MPGSYEAGYLAALPAGVTSLEPDVALAKRVHQIVRADLALREDLDFGREVHTHCRIPGTEPGDYLFREVALGAGRALLSIRFYGGDLALRFVEVVQRDFDPTGAAIRELFPAAMEAYSKFAPSAIRLLNAAPLELGGSSLAQRADLILLAERWGRMRNVDGGGAARLELASPRLDAIYETYAAEYVREAGGAALPMARAESRERLQELAERGLAFEVRDGDDFVGLWAGEPGRQRHLEGFQIVEQFLRPHVRGRGWAAPLQRRFLARLGLPEDRVVFGSIDERNRASVRTAERLGRQPAGSYRFVGPEDAPLLRGRRTRSA